MATVVWRKKALKQLTRIDTRYQSTIVDKVGLLNAFPTWPENFDVKKLQGSENSYRLRIGNYRILFLVIDDEPIVISIEAIAKRDEQTYR